VGNLAKWETMRFHEGQILERVSAQFVTIRVA
jgi:hypothetical protein